MTDKYTVFKPLQNCSQPEKTLITIIDSIMGSGKTRAMINFINEKGDYNHNIDAEYPWLIITPYLEQVNRFLNETDKKLSFQQPSNCQSNKTSDLLKLAEKGKNIVTSHSLFLQQPPEVFDIIKKKFYTLVIDEDLQVIQEYNEIVHSRYYVTKEDLDWLLAEKLIEINKETNDVIWNGVDPVSTNWKYSKIRQFAIQGCLKYVNGVLFWQLNPIILAAFSEVFILTYLFKGSLFESYLKLNNFTKIKILSAAKINNKYQFVDFTSSGEIKQKLKNQIQIYEGKYNEMGENNFAFSKNWLYKKSKRKNDLDTLLKLIYNYKHAQHLPTDSIMWTTIKVNKFHEKIQSIKGFKYTKNISKAKQNLSKEEIKKYEQFVSCNARATELYADRYNLIYFCNRFINPFLIYYFDNKGIKLDQENYALTNLIQWIFRSRIRQGEKITVYIPSKRMRTLFIKWLENAEI